MNSDNNYIGYLTTIVSTANGALPVSNARVAIYERGLSDNSTEESDVIYLLNTDISGRTEKVALQTKSKDLSITPDNPIPYLSYDIYVTADGYYDATFLNVPIFQGISSLQNVYLIPLSEFARSDDFVPNEGRFNSEATGKYV
ncbi:MAG: hypothetical protein IJW54_07135 [Clostridia bacterium]|nr:hypothetical protein [Clostridia bacterium]